MDEVRARVKPLVALSMRRPPIKEKQTMLIVALRYGSLTDFSRAINSYTAVARQLTMPVMTTWAVINRFHRNGDKYVRRKQPGAIHRKRLSPEQEKDVCSSETLTRHRFLSIEERLKRIEEEIRLAFLLSNSLNMTTMLSYIFSL